MSRKLRAAKNVSATWLCLLVHAVVSFFLSPFVLHRVGDAGFSVWVLVFSLTGYFGLLDLGIRSAIIRFVAHNAATGDEDELRRCLATSLGFYSMVAVVILLLTGVGWYRLLSLFKIPVSLLPTARLLLLMVGVSVALTFPLSVFAGALEGLQKFARVQFTQGAATVLRGVGVALALAQGGGLITIGLITVVANLAGYFVLMCVAYRRLPFALNMRDVDPRIFKTMLQHGAFAFIIVLAEKLRFQSDAVVIGIFLSSTAITFYAIASKLVEYSTYAVRSMAQIFTPMASEFHATGDQEQLRRVLLAGNRACALVVFPLVAILVLLGRSIIEIWVGPKYASSYLVLILLIVPKGLYLAQSASTRILLGTGRHQMLAWVLLLEGTVNVLLSITLLPHFGIVGVALGTAVPLACTSLIFLPWHVSRRLGVPLKMFLKNTYLPPLGICLPQVAILWYLNYKVPAHNYVGLIEQVGCSALVYGVTLAGSFLLATPKGMPRLRGLNQLVWPQFGQK